VHHATRLGYLTRAVMDNREEAVATGINVHRISAIAFGIGLGLAAVAGSVRHQPERRFQSGIELHDSAGNTRFRLGSSSICATRISAWR
jgi:ABC-type uncharacterized transport system permease subunit